MAEFDARVIEVINDQSRLQTVVCPMLAARRDLQVQHETLHGMVLSAVKSNDVCRRLLTVPGVGTRTPTRPASRLTQRVAKAKPLPLATLDQFGAFGRPIVVPALGVGADPRASKRLANFFGSSTTTTHGLRINALA